MTAWFTRSGEQASQLSFLGGAKLSAPIPQVSPGSLNMFKHMKHPYLQYSIACCIFYADYACCFAMSCWCCTRQDFGRVTHVGGESVGTSSHFIQFFSRRMNRSTSTCVLLETWNIHQVSWCHTDVYWCLLHRHLGFFMHRHQHSYGTPWLQLGNDLLEYNNGGCSVLSSATISIWLPKSRLFHIKTTVRIIFMFHL